MRLCKMLLNNQYTKSSETYALFALMCFHSARLESKTNAQNELLDLEHQDRKLWHLPLIALGNTMMYKAVEKEVFSCYHYEAAIASEHLKAVTFKDTDWDKILYWYECLNNLQPMKTHQLTMAVICLQKKELKKADAYLKKLKPEDFEQRKYLFYGAKSDFYKATNNINKAIEYINLAIECVNNQLEKEYLIKKKSTFIT